MKLMLHSQIFFIITLQLTFKNLLAYQVSLTKNPFHDDKLTHVARAIEVHWLTQTRTNENSDKMANIKRTNLLLSHDSKATEMSKQQSHLTVAWVTQFRVQTTTEENNKFFNFFIKHFLFTWWTKISSPAPFTVVFYVFLLLSLTLTCIFPLFPESFV